MNNSRTIIVAMLSLALGACDGILDLKDLEAVSEADVWNDASLAEAYGNRLYMDNLPGWSDDDADRSDEAAFSTETDYMYGQLTENSVDYWPYEQIRRINILLAEVDEGTISQSLKDRLKGEARFFRAWRYWEMVKRYGGVPLILEPQELSDDLLVERASTSAVMSQIIADLDEAIGLLPEIDAGSAENDGHLHVGTALALKGRILLDYASPQFNRSGDEGRWQDAYQANLEAKQYLDAHGFGLHPDFQGLWFDELNREAIFVRRYSYPVDSHNWAAGTRPLDVSQGSTDDNRPTLEMVQAFPMADGRPIDGHPEYDPVYYWQNRDPRFQATIAYNGAVWELGGEAGRRQWTYVGGEDNNPTQTGFYTRKAVNPADDAFEAANGDTQWIEIRYAELLLNLAEAANQVGQTQVAYDQLLALRERAGIEPGGGLYGLQAGMNEAELQDAIMLERRIELAFEAKRHWDLRRNMLFEEELNGTRRHGLRTNLIVPVEEWEAAQGTVDLQTEYDQYFEHEIILLDTHFDINWQPNYYFYAIPQDHLRLNSRLEQKEGWAGGTFDPLE
jgi:starch-binding outer membrane protein, SusD/RagB family